MLKVLYLHNSAAISGGERSLLQLWAGLDRSEFTPHLLIPCEGPLADEARRRGVVVGILAVPSLRAVAGWVRALGGLVRYVQEKNIAVVHSYTPRNNILAACVGRLKNVPVIWHERNLLWQGEWDVTRALLSWPRAVICNSYAVARRFERGGRTPRHVHVIHNGVDLARFVPAADKAEAKRMLGLEGKKVVGVVSNLHARKGISFFLEAASLICRERSDVSFVVVGGEYGTDNRLAEVRRSADDMGLGERMVFAGFQMDVRPYLAAFDVSCHVTEKEACSRAVLEAMAMGVPAVAWRDGGNPELIEEERTGILVPTGDIPVLASRLLAFVDNDEQRACMGREARARVETHFDAQRNAMMTMELYREVRK